MYDFSIGFETGKLREYGFKGACIVKEFKSMKEYEAKRAKLQKEFLLGVKIKAKDVKELLRYAKEFKDADYLTIDNPKRDVFRKALDLSLVDSVSGLELIKGFDRLHYRKTLLNQVTAKLMSKHRISMVLEFNNLRRAKGLWRAVIWGRMLQNTWICVKKKVPIIIASGAQNEDEMIHSEVLLAFGQLLKMNKGQAKQALTYAQEKIINRKES